MKKSIATLIMVVSVLISLIVSKKMGENSLMIPSNGNSYFDQPQPSGGLPPKQAVFKVSRNGLEDSTNSYKDWIQDQGRSGKDSVNNLGITGKDLVGAKKQVVVF
ncbi:hypothetical protein GCM10027566_33980 [Arachidicoccus ginsenosidivorans]|uniref:Uncharacterized protein n=1 Tax=Arachidicoccus ginsenosidivorans TaxID=496057 RepID=A0A5B8VLX2_9BACT|nr:hypothetical protein [Arachidicoccus ginsenosidivorans]QEC71596.1 hypothetical protein FSB73_07885 [Arachidicoccus ginsenosidivorans]